MKKITFLILLLCTGSIGWAHDHVAPHLHPGDAEALVGVMNHLVLPAMLICLSILGYKIFRRYLRS